MSLISGHFIVPQNKECNATSNGQLPEQNSRLDYTNQDCFILSNYFSNGQCRQPTRIRTVTFEAVGKSCCNLHKELGMMISSPVHSKL
jgi:hypothetical protein